LHFAAATAAETAAAVVAVAVVVKTKTYYFPILKRSKFKLNLKKKHL
jgi:hypothetical protein